MIASSCSPDFLGEAVEAYRSADADAIAAMRSNVRRLRHEVENAGQMSVADRTRVTWNLREDGTILSVRPDGGIERDPTGEAI